MADANQPRSPAPPRPRARVAVHPQPALSNTGRSRPPIGLRPILRSLLEQFMVAGPVLGVLSALYSNHLASSSPGVPDAMTHAVIRETQAWHGHFLRAYYITPAQNTLGWVLAVPAMVWVVGLIVTIVALGIRSHYAKR